MDGLDVMDTRGSANADATLEGEGQGEPMR